MKGKLIVIDGVDFSGKETQTAMAAERLRGEGIPIVPLTFPDYQSESSALVKMYLKGMFGADPRKVDPYPVSTFFAIDRYASYVRKWSKEYEEGKIILADRYVTSNLIHQAAKINESSEKKQFLAWLEDLEYEKFKLPRPDGVIFLDMPPEAVKSLMPGRSGEKDIHELDEEYLQRSYENACEIAAARGWSRISCVAEVRVRSREEIHHEVYQTIKKLIKG